MLRNSSSVWPGMLWNSTTGRFWPEEWQTRTHCVILGWPGACRSFNCAEPELKVVAQESALLLVLVRALLRVLMIVLP